MKRHEACCAESEHTIRLNDQIRHALRQDWGPFGDVTSNSIVEHEATASAEMVVKDTEGIVSGIEVAKMVFEVANPEIQFDPLLKDGAHVKKGDVIANITGNARSILSAERVSLEFIRRMSGIATKTKKFVDATEGTIAVILDTRKILPGYGELDKQAVRDGGGTNHRRNLSEMGLIKNNHIDLVNGDIELAIQLFREKYPDIPLEVEVRNEKEFMEALLNTPERILLDNLTNLETERLVSLRNDFFVAAGIYIPLEASGNMTLERVPSVAATGIDFISVGELTHSVNAFDISLHISINH